MAFLCSPGSALINGQTIIADGGLSLATMPTRPANATTAPTGVDDPPSQP